MLPPKSPLQILRSADLRPTRQRLSLAKMLFVECDQHVTADWLYNKALSNGVSVSLATVYNTLNQFTKKGLLRHIIVDSNSSYFDTNTNHHHHFFFEGTGQLKDIPSDVIKIHGIPLLPDGATIDRIDIIIRVR
ncbi:MAG: transcriptional repressor [Magnetovibrio sp.]|nr:transcriptional repressor [Magnetovibrio sp.]